MSNELRVVIGICVGMVLGLYPMSYITFSYHEWWGLPIAATIWMFCIGIGGIVPWILERVRA
jgi:hypothetical protein